MSTEVAATPEKVGAGLLFSCGSSVLLLLRTSQNHHNTWGLPGGNVESGDNDILQTALREATEELTVLPRHQVLLPSMLTKRGKRRQKHYTVFACKLTEDERAAYKPQLNEEHSQWRWFDVAEARGRDDLHPVARLVLDEHWTQLSQLLAL